MSNVIHESVRALSQQIRYGSTVNMTNSDDEYDKVLMLVGASAGTKEDAADMLKALGMISYEGFERELYTRKVSKYTTTRDENPAVARYRIRRGLRG